MTPSEVTQSTSLASFFQNILRTFHFQKFSPLLIVLAAMTVYAPFMGSRVLRPAGDDKVYVSQAVEMERDGRWFLQSMANEPNYFKGPFHYIMLRIGSLIFGRSMWATVYMHLLLMIIASLAMASIINKYISEEKGYWLWAPCAFFMGIGIYAHAFSSQMEVEIASLFLIGLYFLDRSRSPLTDLPFWCIAGIVGWVKSPVHSVLLGVCALLFWTIQGTLLRRALNWKSYLPAFAGIGICIAGFMPAYLLDNHAFVTAYINRENLDKPPNGRPWQFPVFPFVTYFHFPWVGLAFVAYFDFFKRIIFRVLKGELFFQGSDGSKRLFILGAALVAPSVLFFLWHPYRGQNYNLPVIGGAVLMFTALWATSTHRIKFLYATSAVITAIAVFYVPYGISSITQHFQQMPSWWPSSLEVMAWVMTFATLGGMLLAVAKKSVAGMALSWIPFYLFLGSFFVTLGEREMIDARNLLAEKEGEVEKLGYYNLEKNIWSEWGYLNYMISFPVYGIFNEDDLEAATERSDWIAIPGDKWLHEYQEYLRKHYPTLKPEIRKWSRWRTKGRGPSGHPLWQEAWDARDFSILERNFYLVNPRFFQADK